jgi:phosphatidylglycerol lysyltransferase
MKKLLFAATVLLTLLSGFTTILSSFAFYHHSALIGLVIGQNTGRLATVLIGLTQLYLAFNLAQYKRMAWWLASVMSVVAFAVQYLRHAHLFELLLPLVLFGSLLLARNQYRVRSEPLLILAGIRRACLIIAIATFAGTCALWEISPVHFGVDFDIWPAFSHSVAIVLLGQNNLHPLTRHAQQFLDTLHLLGILSYAFVIYSLFRPLYDRFVLTPHNQREVERLIRLYGDSSEDIFKLWPADKSYFFEEQHEGFIAYKLANGCAIALADPICAAHIRTSFTKQFADYCAQHGWIPVFIQVPDISLTLYEHTGYNSIKIGESAVINLATFVETTARNKHFRNIANRFIKQGYEVAYYRSPHSPGLLQELRRISDSWLTLPGRSERGFGLGYFDETYLQMSHVTVLCDATGQIVAFANQQPNYSHTQDSIDLMRHTADAPPNVMDFLLHQMLLKSYSDGWKTFDLGLVPLAGVGREKAAPTYEKLMSVFYERGDRVFAFSGLYRFKNKFEPEWEPNHLVYNARQTSLPRIVLALANVLR